MATLANVRDRVDSWLAARWPTVQARQEAYLAAHGHYWQGIRSTILEPNHTTADFADTIPDNMSSKPTDQVETWMDFLPEMNNTSIPAVFIMDVYQSPQGSGYVAHVLARYNGTLYHRAQNVGPESFRTQAWHIVTES